MIFLGTFVDCPQLGKLDIYRDYVLRVDDGTGLIADFAPRLSEQGSEIIGGMTSSSSSSSSSPDRPAASDTVETLPPHSFLLPTFCDVHLHAPQALYLGTGLHLPLLQWLDAYAFAAEERIDRDYALASSVYTRLARRLVENGTGAALLFGTIRVESNLLLAKIFQEAGLRAFVGKLSMDVSSRPSYVEPSASDSARSARHFIDACAALSAPTDGRPPPRVRPVPVITPRFVPTCSTALLAQLGALARETGAMVQSHLAESRDETAWVRQHHGVDDIDVFAESGLLTDRAVHAHCTYLSPASLARAQTAVAHCPLSNAYFSARPFPLREALDRGVRVGLGTDVAGGYELDVMHAMRAAVFVSKLREGRRQEEEGEGEGAQREDGGGRPLDIDWKEALYLGTTGGARALNLPVRSHAFEVGSPFDMQQIDLYDEQKQEGIGKLDFFDPPPPQISEEMVEKWWCLGDHRNRSAVYVQGKRIL